MSIPEDQSWCRHRKVAGDDLTGKWACVRCSVAFIRAAAPFGATPSPKVGTETACSLEGVHEHVFRGPHRFREWKPQTPPRFSHEDYLLYGDGIDPGLATRLGSGIVTDRAERGLPLDRALSDAFFAGFRAGLEDEPTNWNITDEALREWADNYVTAAGRRREAPR